jgi:hypothetical protein
VTRNCRDFQTPNAAKRQSMIWTALKTAIGPKSLIFRRKRRADGTVSGPNLYHNKNVEMNRLVDP